MPNLSRESSSASQGPTRSSKKGYAQQQRDFKNRMPDVGDSNEHYGVSGGASSNNDVNDQSSSNAGLS